MQPGTRLRFQGKCLVGDEGYRYMTDDYDSMPREVRLRLQSSAFNLCAACVWEESHKGNGYIQAINKIEAIVLDELGEFGPQPVNTEPLVAKPRRRIQRR